MTNNNNDYLGEYFLSINHITYRFLEDNLNGIYILGLCIHLCTSTLTLR